MKNSPLTTVLQLLLLGSALCSVFYCWSLISKTRQLRNQQTYINWINYRQPALQALINDSLEYSKKNPAINPILDSLKQAAATANATNKPLSH
jgi:hypothetical protein